VRCAELRDLLTRRTGEASAQRAGGEVAAHLASCPACARYAARLARARAVLAREGEVFPDPGFARRVVARLPGSAQVLGWAALRALPAAIVLALAISAFGLLQTPPVDSSFLGGDESNETLFTYAALPPDAGVQPPAPAPQERR
jgi:anti-sigma factor RsiW